MAKWRKSGSNNESVAISKKVKIKHVSQAWQNGEKKKQQQQPKKIESNNENRSEEMAGVINHQ
jgi:hypothetical protein